MYFCNILDFYNSKSTNMFIKLFKLECIVAMNLILYNF